MVKKEEIAVELREPYGKKRRNCCTAKQPYVKKQEIAVQLREPY